MHYWTHDRANRRYLWGGIAGNPAYDDFQEGRFYLFTGGKTYYIVIELGHISESYNDIPYKLEWKRIIDIAPSPSDMDAKLRLLEELKEALLVYGIDGYKNQYTPNRKVTFGF